MTREPKARTRETIHTGRGDFVLIVEECECGERYERVLELIDELRKRERPAAQRPAA